MTVVIATFFLVSWTSCTIFLSTFVVRRLINSEFWANFYRGGNPYFFDSRFVLKFRTSKLLSMLGGLKVFSFEWRERVTTRMFPVSILMSNPLQKPNNSRRACRVVLVASQTENSFPWPPVTSNFPMPAESLLALDCFALPKQ